MKKWLAMLALCTTVSVAAEDEFGIGILVDIIEGNNDISVAVKYNQWKFDIDGNAIAFDRLFIENELSGELGWFFGLGGYTDFNFNAFGLRLPVGLEYELASNFDIFAEAVFHYAIEPNVGSNGVGYDAGLRYFF